jgi:hypothetical protein
MNKFLLILFFFFSSFSIVAQKPEMYYGDSEIENRPFSKDPYVIFLTENISCIIQCLTNIKKNGL